MKATIPVCGKYGLIMDQPPQELPLGAWSRAGTAEHFKDQLFAAWYARRYG